MNEKFFSLPEERQRAMLNAGYRVFAHNSYKKSPMSEIADAAGISKALLFHYFGNKKGLYLFPVGALRAGDAAKAQAERRVWRSCAAAAA